MAHELPLFPYFRQWFGLIAASAGTLSGRYTTMLPWPTTPATPEPSSTNIEISRLLQEALKLIEVRLLDHMVVSPDKYASLAKLGIL